MAPTRGISQREAGDVYSRSDSSLPLTAIAGFAAIHGITAYFLPLLFDRWQQSRLLETFSVSTVEEHLAVFGGIIILTSSTIAGLIAGVISHRLGLRRVGRACFAAIVGFASAYLGSATASGLSILTLPVLVAFVVGDWRRRKGSHLDIILSAGIGASIASVAAIIVVICLIWLATHGPM